VQVEDRLASTLSDVDDHSVVDEPLLARRVGDEVQHPLGLIGGELPDVVEARYVPLGKYEKVYVGNWIDVPDRDETVRLRNVVSLAVEPAKEAVLRQR
jgi:hypothetical protein